MKNKRIRYDLGEEVMGNVPKLSTFSGNKRAWREGGDCSGAEVSSRPQTFVHPGNKMSNGVLAGSLNEVRNK